MHIPKSASAKSIRYVIKVDGAVADYSLPIDHSANQDQWVQLQTTSTAVFDLTTQGYLGLSLGTGAQEVNAGVPVAELAALDAAKFERVVDAGGDATQAEINSLTSVQQSAAWAYYQSPARDQWYISHQLGDTYMLSLATGQGGEMVWGSLASGGRVATMNFAGSSVSIASSITGSTSSSSYPAITVTGGRQLVIQGPAGVNAAQKIAGASLAADWYFFQVASTSVWYIVNIAPGPAEVYRLKLNSTNTNYDWVKISNAQWTKAFSVNSAGTSASITLRSQ